MNKDYPKFIQTKEDVEYIVENFPKEIWEEDIKELYYLARGWRVLGSDPKLKEDGTGVTYTPIPDEERIEVENNDDKWENATQTIDDTESAEFVYKGKRYYAEFIVLEESIVGKAGISIDRLEELLFDDEKYNAVMDELNEMQAALDEDEELDRRVFNEQEKEEAKESDNGADEGNEEAPQVNQ